MNTPDVPEELAPRAFLHDDPDSYLAGVHDALEVAGADPQEREGSPA